MSAAALLAGLLAAAGTFMLLRGAQLRLIIGFILLGHAVNVVLLSAGGLRWRAPAFAGDGPGRTDPLPQAFALTAIVITFGITIYLLGLLARTGRDPADDRAETRPGDGREQDEL
ncbi:MULTISPECIES: sodium:proton antiporter [unclassified Micromonospora]|uniref:sodium:proton antiporter n=1 Tax=unclassified Micromonospora TaxID=2617518 RepID=UPI001C2371AA|nr:MULTISPECIES: sodium:proton antiporter [unclassified Micromonospora]MBU8859521.1 sodium:proton antiporter [Micromonospora sp. WMMB482]MDM4779037.1 sodium:proton antiporter [Micromonospora sp. b486]